MALWTPANLPTAPLLWFDAADTSTMTFDATTKKVSEWRSKTGGRFATQSDPAKQPTLGTDPNTGKPALVFAGGQYLTGMTDSAFPAGRASWYVLAVGRPTQDFVQTMFFYADRVFATDGSGKAAAFYLNRNTAIQSPKWNGSVSRVVSHWLLSQTQGYLNMDGTDNPVATVEPSINTANLVAFGIGWVNGSPTFSGGTYYLSGYVSELIVAGYVPVSDDRSRAVGYAEWKNGTQANLPASDPYKTAAPTDGADGAKAGAAATLAPTGATGVGALRITGATAPAVGDVGAFGAASARVAASAEVALDAVTSSATSSAATSSIAAQAAAMLAPVAASGAAESAIIASASTRIGDVVASGAGAALVSSSAAADLAAVLIAGSASLPVGATSEQSLTPASAAGTGGLAITASSSPVLRPVGAAVVAAVTITGLAAGAVVAPINVAASAGAQQLTAAFAAIDLAAIGAIGASSVDLQGNVAATLSALAGVGSANVPAVGNAGVLIGHTAGQAIARTGLAGLAAVSIGSVASTVQARTIVTAVIAAGLRPVTVVGLGATGSAPVGPIVIPARNRFVIPARQRSFTVPPRQRSFLIRKGTCMSSITKYAAEERQYQADWSADLNGQTISGDIVPSSNDPTLIVDRVTYDGPVMKFWVRGGTSGRVATIRFVALTSGGEDLAWQQTVVVH